MQFKSFSTVVGIAGSMIGFLVLSLLLAGCFSQEPSENAIQTAIALTISPQSIVQPTQDMPAVIETTPKIGVDELQSPPLPTALEPAQVMESTESPCEVEKWEIIPTGLYDYPQGDGWNILIIPIATHNGSSYWGSLSLSPDSLEQVTLTTEGGFEYQIHRNEDKFFYLYGGPADSPYSFDGVKIPNRISSNVIPPGFTTCGDFHPGASNSGLVSMPEKLQQLIFRVPETQKHFLISIPSLTISCYTEGGHLVASNKPPVAWDLDKDVRDVNYPTVRPSSDFQGFEGSTLIKGDGLFVFAGASRTDWWRFAGRNEELHLFFSMQNTNQGYDTEEGFNAYLIGDDGISRNPGCGNVGCTKIDGAGDSWSTLAGPGQVVEVAVAYLVKPYVRNLKLVCFDPGANFFAIYNISEEQ
jgi:hypothetical protein